MKLFNDLELDIKSNLNNSKNLLKALKSIGKISDNDSNDYYILLDLLNHKVMEVRLESVKNLGKFKDEKIQEELIKHFKIEVDSIVKRECVSSIGRQRNPLRIPFFIEVLKEEDPKIVLQSIRSLLVFKKNKNVIKSLESISNHPNEMIKEVLEIELNPKLKKTKIKHTSVDEKLKNVVVNGDVLKVLEQIENESFHLTFTSPPYYNARDYSFYQSYSEYLDFLRKVFKETHRLTKNGRFLIVNTSPIIIPRVSRSHSSKRYPIPFDIHNFLMEDGWDFIDDIIWQKPEYSVKNRVGGFMQHRKPLGYKPNCTTEYIMVYRKKSTDLIDWNIKQYDPEIIEESKVNGEFDSTNVWLIDPSGDKTHSAVFPELLCKKVIQYYSYKNDLLFDPFGGSGTFGKVSKSLDRNFFLTELDEVYFERIKEKIGEEANYLKFNEFKQWMQKENHQLKK
jgi:DNA modification methylase